MAHLEVSEASEPLLPSLSNIAGRAFHSNNEFHRLAMPDTPLMKNWWTTISLEEIQNPRCHVLTVVDPARETSDGPFAAGVLLLRLKRPGESPSLGVFANHPPTADHDPARYAAATEPGEPSELELAMIEREVWIVELFGVDDQYKGKGLGKKLLEHACGIILASGKDCVVTANLKAKAFYERFGFASKEEMMLPGQNYGFAFLVHTVHKHEIEKS